MNMHKRIRLTPHDRKEIRDRYRNDGIKITYLADSYRVSRTTIYKVLARARKQEFKPRNSANEHAPSAEKRVWTCDCQGPFCPGACKPCRRQEGKWITKHKIFQNMKMVCQSKVSQTPRR